MFGAPAPGADAEPSTCPHGVSIRSLLDTRQFVSSTSLARPSGAEQSCLSKNRSIAFTLSSISGGAEENCSSYPQRRHRIVSGAGSGGPVAHERNPSRWASLALSVTGDLDFPWLVRQ